MQDMRKSLAKSHFLWSFNTGHPKTYFNKTQEYFMRRKYRKSLIEIVPVCDASGIKKG